MKAIVSYLFMPQKYNNSKQNTEMKSCILCLGNISKDFAIDKMKKPGLKGVVEVFPVDYNAIDTNDIFDIHRYLVKETWYKIMFGFTKKIIRILSSCIKSTFSWSLPSNYKEPINWVSLNNRKQDQQ